MKSFIVGRWGSALWDRREAGAVVAPDIERVLPLVEDFPEDTVAVMSGKGFLVFRENFNFAAMIREYVNRVQAEYACGRCLTGLKGTKMLQLILDRIAAGEGGEADLDLLERTAEVLDDSAKCSVCQSAGELVKDGLTLFREDFERAALEGLPETATRYTAAISAPCMTACPCHINIPAYVERLQEARYEESLAVIREEMPLPGITGRVCPAPCQDACTLANQGSSSIPIRILKRVAADYEMDHKTPPPLNEVELTEAPAAVVGAGPSGLSAAYYLNRLGHPVTIFERLPLSGGMVGVGIPPYRQPRDVLERDVGIIRNLGVHIESGKTLGKDFTIDDLFARGFKAILLGVGAHRSVKLGVEGEDADVRGVYAGGVDFLRDLNLGIEAPVGERVVIVGGGNTAIDCARAAVRMGASEVHVVYRRTENEMPAASHEVEDSREEGIEFHFLTQPVEILHEDGRLTGLKCVRMELGEPDWSGRRRPVPVEGSEFVFEADTLIPAIGQKPDLSFLESDGSPDTTRWATLAVDKHTMMTSIPGVFAAGDATSGPLTVVHAAAGGKAAALSMHDFLTTGKCSVRPEQRMMEILEVIEKDTGVQVTPRREAAQGERTPPRKLDMRERLGSFREVETGFTQYGSFVESSRCLRCYHLVLVGLAEESGSAQTA